MENENFDAQDEDTIEDDILSRFFNSPVEFSLFIENMALQKDMDILECLTEYVTENSIDEESIPALLTDAIKCKIMEEARKKYIMPRDDEPKLEF